MRGESHLKLSCERLVPQGARRRLLCAFFELLFCLHRLFEEFIEHVRPDVVDPSQALTAQERRDELLLHPLEPAEVGEVLAQLAQAGVELDVS